VRLFYLPIEPYQERYTELLMGWTISAFDTFVTRAPGRSLVVIEGERRDQSIKTGHVLDAYGRSIWALEQTKRLLLALEQEPATDDDIIYIDDMFHPGYEALPYLFHQTGTRPRIYTRNHAQSVDAHDFTFPMRSWMRHFELLVCKTVSGVICASRVHKTEMEVALWEVPIHVLGLPFNRDAVRAIAGPLKPRGNRPRRVMWASRWDLEKQPGLFCSMVEKLAKAVEFVACTGSHDLRGTDKQAIAHALKLEQQGKLTIIRGATKQAYYQALAQCRAHFLASLQDYVSYCLLDASALDVVSIAPAYKSFPETLAHNHRRLYVPFNALDAEYKLIRVIENPEDHCYAPHLVAQPADHHHETLDRIVDLFEGE
jgi:glycosyltransferase involved in cell wall biosynthesis